MAKYYAVKIGRSEGIFNTWDQCKQQVHGYPGAVYKSFASLKEAKAFLDDIDKPLEFENGIIAYVDGSYNLKTKEYGYGCILLENQNLIKTLYGKGNREDYAAMRNVSGEILGCLAAINYAISHHYQQIAIYYDYEGVEKWATGQWQANKELTRQYRDTIARLRHDINICFIKVLAHSGDTYNEMADALAKKAVGLKNDYQKKIQQSS
ncbi:viroplasmin family protein [[Clostridium] spiroforme]|nr:viroplasmin family protein [Thomasclavelia spiroformis]MBM6880775.1 viroplasmin family protein [Thomasclavelia spiroformis]MBM6931192.1 viroplasmin family protein [Thomasclavelia spiroformis]